MSISKRIRVSFVFTKFPDTDLLARGRAVLAGVFGNPVFTAVPPVDEVTVKTELEKFATLITAALDGGKKVHAEKTKQRGLIIGISRTLGHYVEANCNNDMPTFLSSGFEAVPPASASEPLDQPIILDVTNGNAGQLLVKITPVKRARNYVVRFGAMAGGNTTPAVWEETQFPSVRAAAALNRLTPGTTYAIQVCAYGKLGFTEWSHPAIKMCS